MAEENLIQVSKTDPDVIQAVEHFATIGENIVTCNFAVENPKDKIGQEVTCPKCGQKFKIVWYEGPDGPVKI